MNRDVDGNGKLFWKKVSKVNCGKIYSCSKIKDGNGRLALGEDEKRGIWRDYAGLLQSKCVASMVFREVITWEENQ